MEHPPPKTLRAAATALALAAACALGTLVAGCGGHHKAQLRETADSFGVAYFNWRFAEAARHATPSSRKWLAFAASQVHQADVDSLRAMPEGATCELGDIRYEGERKAAVAITVSHFLQMGAIGTGAHRRAEARFILPMRFDGRAWRVDLNGLPRAVRE